jgi:hypothetical protein
MLKEEEDKRQFQLMNDTILWGGKLQYTVVEHSFKDSHSAQ